MATLKERVQAAWDKSEPLALHHEVERLASEGFSQQSLEDALESLLDQIRARGATEESEEIINGVWDRLTGWCHAEQRIHVQTEVEAKGISNAKG